MAALLAVFDHGHYFAPIFFKFQDVKIELRKLWLTAFKMAAKNKMFDFVLHKASKVSISTSQTRR